MTDGIFGLSEKALNLCEERAVTLTNNLVNSSTPNYKARDIDFQQAMQSANQGGGMELTNPGHIAASGQLSGAPLAYRIPMQTSMDGNTVDPEIERKNFIENALRYQVNLTFVHNKTEELHRAIKGD